MSRTMRNLRSTAALTFLAFAVVAIGLLVFLVTSPASAADAKCLTLEVGAPVVVEVDAPEGWFEYCTPGVDSKGNVYPEKTEVDGVVVNNYPMECATTKVGGSVIHTSAPVGPNVIVRATVLEEVYDHWATVQCTNVKGAGLVTAATLFRFPAGGTPGSVTVLPGS